MPFETVVDNDGKEILQYVMPTEEKEDDLDKKDTELINDAKDRNLIGQVTGGIRNTVAAIKPTAEWAANTARAGVGKFGQEFLVDYPNDFYENQKLNANSLRNNPRAILGDEFKVENDNLWVIDQYGDQRSLKTGQKYVKGYLKSLLNFTDIADKNELIEHFNNNPESRIPHPALFSVNERKEFLTTYNADKDPDQRIGPTGDFGVPIDKKFFGETINERFAPEGGYEHGEETVGTLLAYLVPTALLMYATRGAAKSTLPSSVHALPTRLFSKLDKMPNGKVLSGIIRNSVEGAIEGGAVAHVMDANPEGDGTFFGIGKKIDITDDNETRRRIGQQNDYLLGAGFGNILGFGIPAARSGAGYLASKAKNLTTGLAKKGDQILESVADPIADIFYKVSKLNVDRQNFEIAEDQLNAARELQVQGPTDIKKVIPKTTVKKTDAVSFYNNKIEKEDVIQPKTTQKELDDQAAKAEELVKKQKAIVDQDAADLADTADRVIETEVVDDVPNILNEAKKGDRKVTELLRSKLRGVAQSDGRTLKMFDEAFKQEDELFKPKTTGRKKIEPGTPHPKIEGKVRGYEGRWVTKKHFDKVTESKKGGNKIRRQFGLTEERTAFETKLDEANKSIENQRISEEKGINKIFTEQGIKDFLADLDIEQSKLNKKIGQLGPNIEDAAKRGKKAEFIKAVERNYEISRERDLAKKQRKNIKEGNKEAEKTFERIEAEVEEEMNSMTDAEIRDRLRQNPKYTKLMNDLDASDARIDSLLKRQSELLNSSLDKLKSLDEFIRKNDDYMDNLDEKIFDPRTTAEDRIKLEKLYESADANRQDLKLEKQNQIKKDVEKVTKFKTPIGEKIDPTSPFPTRPTFDRKVYGKPLTNYRSMSIEFESDVDLAIWIVTKRSKTTKQIIVETSGGSKRNQRFLDWLYDQGIDDDMILEEANVMYNTLKANYLEGDVYTFRDSLAWGNAKDLDFEIEYDPEENLEKYIRDLEAKRTEEYRKANDPQDPGDQLDPKNLDFEELELFDFVNQGRHGKDFTKNPQDVGQYIQDHPEIFLPLKERVETVTGLRWEDFVRIQNRLPAIVTPKQARANPNLKVGQVVYLKGASNPTTGLVFLALISNGNYRHVDSLLRTLMHESFHNLQDRLLTKVEIKILDNSRSQLIEMLKKTNYIKSKSFWNDLSNKEIQAYAFGAWDDMRGQYLNKKPATWMQPLEKLRELFNGLANIFKKNHDTWDDLFEKARQGEIAKRQRKAIVESGLDFEIDPDEVRNLSKEYSKRIEDGEMTLDEAMNNKGEDMTRRLQSRSGKTDYVDRTKKDLISYNKAFQDAIEETLGSRADQTGIPSKSLNELLIGGKRRVEEDGYDVAKTINLYDRARKGDLTAQDDLYALAGLIYHSDFTLNTVVEKFIAKENGLDEVANIENNKRILSVFRDWMTLSHAYRAVMRKLGQGLGMAKIEFMGVNLSTMPPRQPVTYTASKVDADAILKTGFQPTEGSLGKGVYFSTEAKPGDVGNINVSGETKNDVFILDLLQTERSIKELVKELKLGKLKATKDGIQLTPKQQEGVQSWAKEKGYGGIRYATDFQKTPQTTDEIIIFDTNNANRFVDSDAAVAPVPKDSTPARPLINQSIEVADDFISKKLPEEVVRDITEGKITQETEETLQVLGRIAYQVKNTNGARKGFYDLFTGIPDGKADKQAVLNAWRNVLFLSPSTWYKVIFGSAYRAAVLPISQINGFTTDILSDSAQRLVPFRGGQGDVIADQSTGMTKNMLNKRRISLSAMTYQKYLQHSTYAMRMMVASMKENEVFVNIGRRQIEGRTKSYANRQQLELNFETALHEETEGLQILADPNANPLAQALAAFNSISGRVMGGLDSFYAGMVGPSTEWVRIMDEQLDKAIRMGYEPGSNEQWQQASEETDKLLKQLFQDVDLADGKVIKNGRLQGEYAQRTMDWINLTTDVEVKPEARTHEFGVKKGRQKGITDSRELMEYAEEYVNEEPAKNYLQPVTDLLNVYGKQVQKLHRGNAGEQIAGGLISPINRTPVNLTKDLLTAVPIARDFVDSYQRDMASENVFQRALTNGYMATASQILAVGYGLHQTGYVRFSPPPSTNTSDRYQDQRIGIQNFGISIKNPVTKKWGPFIDLSPFDLMGTIFSSVGSFVHNYSNLTDYEKTNNPITGNALFAAEMHTIFKTVKDVGLGQTVKTVMGGMLEISDLISGTLNQRKAYEGSRNPWERFLSNKAVSWYPSPIRNAARSLDPYIRQTKTSFTVNGEKHRGMYVNIINSILKDTPGLSQTQPPVLDDITGLPVRNSYILGSNNFKPSEPILKLSNDLFLPQSAFKARDKSISDAHQEIYRLRGRGSYFRMWSPRVFNLPRRKLDELELNRFKVIGTQEIKVGGETLEEVLNRTVIRDPHYNNLPDENVEGQTSEKVKYLQNIIRPFAQKAKEVYEIELITEYKEALANDLSISKNHLGKLILENEARKNKSMSINQTEVNSGVDSWLNTPSLN